MGPGSMGAPPMQSSAGPGPQSMLYPGVFPPAHNGALYAPHEVPSTSFGVGGGGHAMGPYSTFGPGGSGGGSFGGAAAPPPPHPFPLGLHFVCAARPVRPAGTGSTTASQASDGAASKGNHHATQASKSSSQGGAGGSKAHTTVNGSGVPKNSGGLSPTSSDSDLPPRNSSSSQSGGTDSDDGSAHSSEPCLARQ